MKKVLLLLLTVLIASLHASAATPPTLSIEDFCIKAGETKELLIDLNNPDDQVANVQFLLNLPIGLTVTQKDGKSLITLTDRATDGHKVMYNPSNGMVMVYSMPVAAFSGTSGAILSITLTAGTGFAGGEVALKAIVLATEQGGQYKPDDVVYTIENEVLVTSITLNASAKELTTGQTFQLSATVAPSNATNKSVTWSSSNTSVANVSNTGLATAVAAGSAIITCEAQDGSGVKATCNITVKAATVAVTNITLNATSKELTEGETFQLSATVAPSNATNKNVTWSSSNTSVANVSNTGLATAVAAGSATITCEAQDGSGVKATCAVTVKAQSTGNIIQFADAEVKRICVENWDTNDDGELSEDEAAAVTDIGTVFQYNGTITTFNELQYFTGLTSIDSYAFNLCYNLLELTIPHGVKNIEAGAMYECTNLTNIQLPAGLLNIREGAFACCQSLQEIDIPSSVQSIGEQAFRGCLNLDAITIPSGVTEIGDGMFYECKSLASVIIPEGVTSIGKSAFYMCESLMNISLLGGVTTLGNYAFAYCTNLRTVTLPNSLKEIGTATFGMSGLLSINLPSSLEKIGTQAFYGCSNLKSLSIPNKVKAIGEVMVAYCNDLKSLTVDPANPYFRSNGNGIIDKATNLLIQSCPATVIPTDIVGVDRLGFACVPEVEEIIIPENVKTIGICAFEECINLKRVTIPASIEYIGENAFLECTCLEQVTILKPTPVSIADNVFHMKETINNDNTETTTSDFTTATLYVPYGSKSAYQQAEGWKNFQNIVEMEPTSPNIQFAEAEVKRICVNNWDTNGDGELSEAEAAAVSSISGFGANSMITSFNELRYFTGLKSISVNAFERCVNLSEVTMPQQITAIDKNAFDACSSLTSVVIPENVTYIGENAFSRCSGLTSINIPDKVNAISRAAFDACSSLPSITIPASVVSIGEISFDRCSALKSVYALSEDPHGFPSNAFRSSTYQQATLYVPAGTKAKYQSAGGWQNFANIKEIGVTEPELVLTSLYVNGDGIVGTTHTITFSVRNDGGDFNGELHLWTYEQNDMYVDETAYERVIAANQEITITTPIIFTKPGIWVASVSDTSEDQDNLGKKAWTITPAAVLTAKNYTREYGDENPVWEFTADKGGFSGTPKITCEADKYSDVGTYSIVIEQGSVDNNYVTYVNGTLTITKAPLTIEAGDWLNRQGWEPNGITPFYGSFRNGEDKSVLTKEPQFSTTATADSPMGSVHTLTFSGAEAKNYAFTYIPGTITIVGRPGDVNRDSYINTTDAVDVIQYILGYTNSLQHIYDGDLYRDDQITTADLQHVVYYVMTNDQAAARLKAPVASLTNSLLSLSQDEQGRLAVSLKNDVPIIGIQFDVLLPEDGDISEVLLSEARKNGHAVAMRQMENGYYRVLAYSMQNNTLMGNEGLLATLLINGVDGEVVLTNIHVTDAQLVDHALPDVSLSMLTGISTLTEATVPFDIYDLNGRLVRRNATSTKGLRRGFYMINNQKVVIK